MKKADKRILTALITIAVGILLTLSASAASLSARSVKIKEKNAYVLYLEDNKGKVSWTTSNNRVVSFAYVNTSMAVLRMKSKGTAVVTAETESGALTCRFKVKANSGMPKKLTIIKGDSVRLGKNRKKGKWKSSNPQIARVSGKRSSKNITFREKGTVTITEKIGKKKYKCKVSVIDPANERKKAHASDTGSSNTQTPQGQNDTQGSNTQSGKQNVKKETKTVNGVEFDITAFPSFIYVYHVTEDKTGSVKSPDGKTIDRGPRTIFVIPNKSIAPSDVTVQVNNGSYTMMEGTPVQDGITGLLNFPNGCYVPKKANHVAAVSWGSFNMTGSGWPYGAYGFSIGAGSRTGSFSISLYYKKTLVKTCTVRIVCD